jgi:hypothetical protein
MSFLCHPLAGSGIEAVLDVAQLEEVFVGYCLGFPGSQLTGFKIMG